MADEPAGLDVPGLLSQPGFRETLKTAAQRRDDIEVVLR